VAAVGSLCFLFAWMAPRDGYRTQPPAGFEVVMPDAAVEAR
jgi:hypothetical protein